MKIRRHRRFTALSRPWTVLAATGLAAAVMTPVEAQPPPTPFGEVTLFGEEEFKIQAATKTEIPISKAPGAVTVIGARQIRESGARTIPDLLRLVAGVNVRWNPMVQTIDMRSFGQNPFTSRVLLLIDGVPYNSWNKGGFPQHPGFDFFGIGNIKRIEVIRGAGSALYGENAYWGVINIVTLSGEDLEGGKVEAYGGDLEARHLGLTYGKSVGEDASFLISAKTFNGQFPTQFWFGDNDAEVSGTDVFFKGRYRSLEFSYYRHEDDADGFREDFGFIIPGAELRSAESIEQTVDIFALKYNQSFNDGKLSFGGDISFAQRNGSHCGACHAAPQSTTFERPADHGYQLIGDFRLGVRPDEHHDLLFGVELRSLDAGDHSDELLGSPRLPGGAPPGVLGGLGSAPSGFDALHFGVGAAGALAGGTGVFRDGLGEHGEAILSYSKAAFYVQDQISLLEDELQIVLGARFDGNNDLFDEELSPRIAFVWDATDRLVVRGGWSQSFRFPSFSELFQASWFLSLDVAGQFALPLATFDPNPELDREQIESFDFGLQYRINPSLSAKLDLFRSELDDFIVLAFNPLQEPPTIGFENHPGKASIWGSELELRWSVGDKFNGFLNWSWSDPERDDDRVDSTGRPLELVYSPDNKINFGVYFGPFSGFSGSFDVQWRDDYEAPSMWNGIVNGDFSQTAQLDGYTYLNLRLSYDLPFRSANARQSPRLSLYGRNLLDERPFETLVGVDVQAVGSTVFGAFELWF